MLVFHNPSTLDTTRRKTAHFTRRDLSMSEAPPPDASPEPPRRLPRCRDFCITTNNPMPSHINYLIEQLETDIEEGRVSYAIIGEETGATGNHHLQCYIYFSTLKSYQQVHSYWSSNGLYRASHVERRLQKSTPEKAATYCKKDGLFREFGVIPQQGKRTEIDDACDDIDAGMPRDEVFLKHKTFSAKYPEYAEKRYLLNEMKGMEQFPLDLQQWQIDILHTIVVTIDDKWVWAKPEPRSIIWAWSAESGTGKTTFAKYIQSRIAMDFCAIPHNTTVQRAINMFNNGKLIYINEPRVAGQDDRHRKKFSELLETLSDRGIQASDMYHGVQKCLDRAHILVTSNRPPPIDDLPLRFIEFKIPGVSLINTVGPELTCSEFSILDKEVKETDIISSPLGPWSPKIVEDDEEDCIIIGSAPPVNNIISEDQESSDFEHPAKDIDSGDEDLFRQSGSPLPVALAPPTTIKLEDLDEASNFARGFNDDPWPFAATEQSEPEEEDTIQDWDIPYAKDIPKKSSRFVLDSAEED